MGRGLDGYFSWYPLVGGLCSFEGPLRRGLDKFPVAIARGKYLFPFRTEQSSPVAPMVLGLQGPGRVGRRRSFNKQSRPVGRLFFVLVASPRETLRTSIACPCRRRSAPAHTAALLALLRRAVPRRGPPTRACSPSSSRLRRTRNDGHDASAAGALGLPF